MGRLFELGRIDVPPGTPVAAEESGISVDDLVARHARGDWGRVGADQSGRNNAHIVDGGGPLISIYEYGHNTFYIITEADRSKTTVENRQGRIPRIRLGR